MLAGVPIADANVLHLARIVRDAHVGAQTWVSMTRQAT
jgi:hypothetical protein